MPSNEFWHGSFTLRIEVELKKTLQIAKHCDIISGHDYAHPRTGGQVLPLGGWPAPNEPGGGINN